jgi:membrane fusion protein (multidrug efflux system)
MNTQPWLAGLLLIATAQVPDARATDPAPVPPGAETILLRRCDLDFERSTLLGASGSGILKDCLVRPGDVIVEGQVLGRLQDAEARAELELRGAQAESDIEVRLGEAKHGQAVAKLKATEALKRRGFLDSNEYESQRLGATAAALSVEEAKFRRHLASLQRRQAEAALRAREVVAPHAGTVIAVLKRPGESVAAGDPIFRVVDVDHIRVTGLLDVADAARVREGQSVRVSPEVGGADLAIEQSSYLGRVVFVDRVIDPEALTCKVVAEVANRDGLLRAGLRARMEIEQGVTPAAAGPREPQATAAPGRVGR